MSQMGLSFLLMWILRQTSPGAEVSSSALSVCPDKLRVDLSVRTSVQTPEVCISPGQLTGFVFDRPAAVDLQEELRFGEVLRGRKGISFVPPTGLFPGERLRLTVHFAQDPPDQGVTFMLVTLPGRVTHQVDVFHDVRSRESLWQEIEEERVKNQQLWMENQSLRRELTATSALRHFSLSGELIKTGITGRPFPKDFPWSAQGQLVVVEGSSFKTMRGLAVWLVVQNLGPDPWKVTAASLTDGQNQPLVDVDFGEVRPLVYLQTVAILVEAPTEKTYVPGELTLTLRGENSQSITVPHILLP